MIFKRHKISPRSFHRIARHNPGKALALWDRVDFSKCTEDEIFNHRLRLADQYYFRNEYDKALEIYKSVLGSSDNPTIKADALTQRGRVYEDKHDYDKAVKYMEKALTLQPDRDTEIQALTYLGSSYGSKGDYKKAIRCFMKANEICEKPQNSWEKLVFETNLVSIAGLYWELGDKTKMHYFCDKVLSIKSVEKWVKAEAYYLKGYLNAEAGKWKEAINYYWKAYRLEKRKDKKGLYKSHLYYAFDQLKQTRREHPH